MKRTLPRMILGLCAALGAGAPVSAQLPQPDMDGSAQAPLVAPSPSLVFPVIEHDFGQIFENGPVEFSFPFTNKGDGKLVITKAKGSCGCTVPDLAKREFNAGEGSIISVRYDPHGRSGKQRQTITVESNDPDNPIIQLAISATVKQLVAVEPKLVNFAQVPKGESPSTVLTVTGLTEDFEATLATLNDERFEVKILDTIEIDVDGEKLRQSQIEVSLKESAKVGQLQDTLTIRTNDPRMPLVSVPVAGIIMGDIDVLPARLPLGLLRTAQPFSKEVRIGNRANKPFKITKVEFTQITNGVVLEHTLKPAPESPETAYMLMVTGTAPATAGVMRGEVVVYTDVKGEERVTIPIYGTFRTNTGQAGAGQPGPVQPGTGQPVTGPVGPR